MFFLNSIFADIRGSTDCYMGEEVGKGWGDRETVPGPEPKGSLPPCGRASDPSPKGRGAAFTEL